MSSERDTNDLTGCHDYLGCRWPSWCRYHPAPPLRQHPAPTHPFRLCLARTHGRHHSRTTSLLPDTQSLCYPCDTSDRRVGHANGIVAPLWKLCGRARLQFAPCQLYLRIGSHDDTGSTGLDETRHDAWPVRRFLPRNLIGRSASLQ